MNQCDPLKIPIRHSAFRCCAHLLAAALLVAPMVVLADGTGHTHEAGMESDSMAGKTSFGKPGNASAVTRTVEVSMGDDMRFRPDKIDIKQGETIRFKLKNTGTMPHEMVLGTVDEIREHAEMMRQMPNMQHADPNMVRVQPGQSGEIVWNFDLAGDFQYACLIPGHREAGMTGTIQVIEAK
jgi:uncharacterized cupredoxin-like copper-binding protein